MINQEQADRLIEMAKQALRADVFVWKIRTRFPAGHQLAML